MSQQPVTRTVRMSQNQQIVESLALTQRLIGTVRQHEPLSDLLGDFGYNEDGLTNGESLCAALQAALLARQAAIGAERESNTTLRAADATARRQYRDFRRIARVLFRDTAIREALGIEDPVAHDRERFIVQARNSYLAAQLPPYVDSLAQYGFDAAALEAAIAAIHTLQDADATQAIVHSRAKSATTHRNTTAATLHTWMQQFKHVAAVALRDDPHLHQELFS